MQAVNVLIEIGIYMVSHRVKDKINSLTASLFGGRDKITITSYEYDLSSQPLICDRGNV